MSLGPDGAQPRPLGRSSSAPNLTRRPAPPVAPQQVEVPAPPAEIDPEVEAAIEAQVEAELALPADGTAAGPVADPVIALFDTAFTSASLGTEQELSGVRVVLKDPPHRMVGKVVKNGVPLLAITKDMSQGLVGNGYESFTLEIVTTPTEGSDLLGWIDRIEAFDLLVPEIVAACQAGGALSAMVLGDSYELVITLPNHLIVKDPAASGIGVAGSDRQGTLGVPMDWLLLPFAPDRRPAPAAHGTADNPWPAEPEFPLSDGVPMPTWFLAEAAVRAADHWNNPLQEQVYALLESAIQQFLRVLRRYPKVVATITEYGRAADAETDAEALLDLVLAQESPTNLALLEAKEECLKAQLGSLAAMTRAKIAMRKLVISPGWKNKWPVLPRTPLVALLTLLSADEEADVVAAIRGCDMLEFEDELGLTVIAWAKTHILAGQSLGGHHIDPPMIDGRPGFLIEYRGSHPYFFVDKFYYAEPETGIHLHEPVEARRTRARAWLKRRRHSI
ncbi:hypothetical protein [Actinokineospora sp.]|uniref:hypothetical protein n=1 Tax=Actinokineospora sp. TaxID=1872133 RepID=UPI004037A790